MKNIFITLLVSICYMQAWGLSFVVDGIRYRIISKNKVEVVKDFYEGDLTIPEEVTFSGKTYNVTKLGNEAFSTSGSYPGVVNIKQSIKEIDDNAFPYRASFNNRAYLIIYDNETKCFGWIGDKTKCVDIELPSTIAMITKGAFAGCSKLEKINIPENIEFIGDDAFKGCDNLPGMLLLYDNGTKCYGWIGDKTKCVDIEIPETVTEIKKSAFEGCSSLKSIKIPKSIKIIGGDAFKGCDNLPGALLLYDNDTKCYGWIGDKTKCIDIELPNTVTEIKNRAFERCTLLENIVIPNSVERIGALAFDNCGKLPTKMLLYNNNTKCYGLVGNRTSTSIEIPNTVTEIGDNAFAYTNISEIKIPYSVTKIGNSSFRGCNKLTEIKLPNTITDIGEFAFYGCLDLKEINVPTSLKKIGEKAFDHMKTDVGLILLEDGTVCHKYYGKEKILDIPNTVEKIDDNFCSYPYSDIIEQVNLPQSLKEIGSNAFNWCFNLSEVNIPNSVTEIGENAFRHIKNIKLNKLKIPDSVTYIKEQSFRSISLTEVTLPNKVDTIDDLAFAENLLTKIIIPASVKAIGDSAFFMESLKDIYSLNVLPPVLFGYDNYYSPYSFSDSTYSTATLHVSDSVAYYNYKAADGWKLFKNIEVGIPDSIMSADTPLVKSQTIVPSSSAYYDLLGRTVPDPQPGKVYIRNRRKVMMER